MEGGGGGGGPAPFLLKTYDMVDDSSTDDIVSWGPAKTSFVVWNPPDFSARLLPAYFKHNNFSSFIRQLNTYGFRKIDPERWEFANEDFIKGHKHLLKNIHRRKPIHSHSHPPGSLVDSERAALEEEIERLTRERAALQADLYRFKQQQTGTKIQLDDLERRLVEMEQRQLKMIAFLQRAVQKPRFVENLAKMVTSSSLSVDFKAIHKKRRLPGTGFCQEAPENSLYDDHSSTSKPDIGHGFHTDFCHKLKLELCPAISDGNLVTVSSQSSHEDNGSPHMKQPECGLIRTENLPLSPQPLDLSDTGASLCPAKNLWFPGAVDEGDGHFPCHLNLTLASSSMQLDSNQYSSRNSNSADHRVHNACELREAEMSRDDSLGQAAGNIQSTSADAKAASLQEVTPCSNQEPKAPQGRTNDAFWEKFLTERPGPSDTEEASSSFRENPGDAEQEGRKPDNENIWRNRKDMEQLTL
ncbi:heat stress transcription factor A-5-like [Phoenix dactylifera]|uniref:Heat stress transcription factor A-5-like n=1 Tax=Phoenix dactylifera TaxID=42345 RepID=A0A8B7D4W3_PHODC|nr:heat stress transcription factor A-5-like [Phoenix dactylifera]